MFGGNNDQDKPDNDGALSEPAADNLLTGAGASAAVVNPISDGDTSHGSPIGDPAPPPGTPLVGGVDSGDDDSTERDYAAPADSTEGRAGESESTGALAPDNDAPADADGLLAIKQQALLQLGPLVNHLDQTPEEKFRTTMMMIQANDDQSLVKDAYAAAKQIADDKERAQALLDVINEINYFTQQEKS